MMHLPTYALVTPARNEAAFIAKTIDSVLAQTVPPRRWVIVNDGSTDRTREIVESRARGHQWIHVVNRPQRHDRDFAAKVHSFNAGLETLKGVDHDIIGNLDADVSFQPDFFEFLLSRFAEDATLGVAGTVFREHDGYSSETDSFEGHTHVSGQCQLFRRECFEAIGGYTPHAAGGIDWIAVTTARMLGWKTRSFRERSFFHHRSMGTAERGKIASAFSYGEKDYYLGGHPAWEAFRVLYRMRKSPYIIGGLAIGAGYISAWMRGTRRPISPALMRFHRDEQMRKLRHIVRAAVSLRRLRPFEAMPE
jgi:glycosyltransferase involved in cell wall biosynthesis